ncbi:methyltransferase domain-containing protein [Segetibacter koreensis]|uniref:methyltransferase domain-containing protein n=1 Tax=Segetibacter koreensis TaxID=398037 RepID=UPI00037AD443|nr:methyltransferase domain-containing protein [Segetibacter koreensis]
MTFSRRSYQKELLDQDEIPFADIQQNMKELDFINTWLGGHAITVAAFKLLSRGKKEISVCEIGCGGGDNLVAIYNWCQKKHIQLLITGIDIKEECIDYAKSRKTLSSTTWITNDYKKVLFDTKPDIIFSSLFCHHFADEELILQINWMKQNSKIGFFINDLHRNFLAYHSIKLLTRLFSKSYLVKSDAPLSVARGFKRNELKRLCSEARTGKATVTWKWAFRYLIMYEHEGA